MYTELESLFSTKRQLAVSSQLLLLLSRYLNNANDPTVKISTEISSTLTHGLFVVYFQFLVQNW